MIFVWLPLSHHMLQVHRTKPLDTVYECSDAPHHARCHERDQELLTISALKKFVVVSVAVVTVVVVGGVVVNLGWHSVASGHPPMHMPKTFAGQSCVRVCVCMHTCTHHIHACVYAQIPIMRMIVCMHPCIHASMHPCIHASMHTCIHAYMHTCIHAYMHACIHACLHTCIHAYMHTGIHAYRHTGIQAYRHTCIHACLHQCMLQYMA